MRSDATYSRYEQLPTYSSIHQAGPSRTRRNQRFFGSRAESSGVRKFRSLDTYTQTQHSKYGPSIFSPPTSPYQQQKHHHSSSQSCNQPTIEVEPASNCSSPLSSAPSSPLVFSDEEPQWQKDVEHCQVSPCGSSPLSSAPPSPGESNEQVRPPVAPSPALPMPSSSPLAFGDDADCPFQAFDAYYKRHDQPTARDISSTSPQASSSSSSPIQSQLCYSERHVEASPTMQRARRQRRPARRLPVTLTELGQQRHNDLVDEPVSMSSPIQPSIALKRQRQRQDHKSRRNTPPRSSKLLDELLTASQARPDPPKDHPGRSAVHAQERTSDQASYQQEDGNVVDLSSLFGDKDVDLDNIRANTLFIPSGHDSDQEEVDRSRDIVYELLNGHKQQRKKKKFRRFSSSGQFSSPDEVSKFFTTISTTNNKRRSSTDDDYKLEPAIELPNTSSYARKKREESSPTRDIKTVKELRRQRNVTAVKRQGASSSVVSKSSMPDSDTAELMQQMAKRIRRSLRQ